MTNTHDLEPVSYRFVIESAPDVSQLDLETRLAPKTRQYIPVAIGEITFSIEALFEGAKDDEHNANDEFGLANYWLVTLSFRSAKPLESHDLFGIVHHVKSELGTDLAKQVLPVVDDSVEAHRRLLDRMIDRFKIWLNDIDLRFWQRRKAYAWSLDEMNANTAWERTPPPNGHQLGEGAVIALLDTGYTDHPELKDALDLTHATSTMPGETSGQNPLKPGFLQFPAHATAVGSIMASRGNVKSFKHGLTTVPDKSVTGVAPKATILPIRCLDSVVSVNGVNIARGIWYAARNGAHIISMSLGVFFPGDFLERVIQYAVHKRQMIVMAAAGNFLPFVVFPARFPDCIAVAASNRSKRKRLWLFSSSGREVAIAAPGQKVWRATYKLGNNKPPKADWSWGSGTSFAVANLAGVAALWVAFHSYKTLVQHAEKENCTVQHLFQAALQASATEPPNWPKHQGGAGIVDAEALLKRDLTTLKCPPAISTPLRSTLEILSGIIESVSDDITRELAENVAQVFLGLPRIDQEDQNVIAPELEHELMRLYTQSIANYRSLAKLAKSLTKLSDTTDNLDARLEDILGEIRAMLLKNGESISQQLLDLVKNV